MGTTYFIGLVIWRNDPQRMEAFLAAHRNARLSYGQPGLTAQETRETQKGFVRDHHRVSLGSGREVFERARHAFRRWEMFELGWVLPCFPQTPIEVGSSFAVLVRAFGLWYLHACRIVEVAVPHHPRTTGAATGARPAVVARAFVELVGMRTGREGADGALLRRRR